MKYWIQVTNFATDLPVALKAKQVDYLAATLDGGTYIHMYPSVANTPGNLHIVKESVAEVLDKIAQAFVKE